MHVWKSKHPMKNDQSESGAYLSIKRSMHYHKKSGQCTIKSINIAHMSLNRAQKSSRHNSFKLIFILKKILWCRAPTKAHFIFEWINFVNSIIKNYENKFTLILKHFENHRKFKSGSPKREWRPNFMENEILELNKPKEENCKDSKLFESQDLENCFKFGSWEIIFFKPMMQGKSNDKWSKNCMPKVAMHNEVLHVDRMRH